MMQEGMPEFLKLINNQPVDYSKMKPFMQELAKDIVKYKKRLGGNFAVAQAVFNRYLRDAMKEVLGPDCIFVVLRLNKETNAKRVEERHAGGGGDNAAMKNTIEFLNGIYDLYEDAQPDEENCVTVHIGPNDTREDVVNNILKAVEDYGFKIEF